MTFNVDADPINRDWLRVVARYRRIGAEHPDLPERDAFRRAVRAHVAYLRRTATTG